MPRPASSEPTAEYYSSTTAEAVVGEPWSPPAWILSKDARHLARVTGRTSQANPMFRVQSAKLHVDTYHAIRSKIAGTSGSYDPRRREPAFRKRYHRQIQEQQRKLVECQQKLEELLEQKKESLDDIETLRTQEMEREIKTLEQNIRKEHQDKVRERKREWEAQMETEFEERRQRLKKDQELRRQERNRARAEAKPTEAMVQPVAEVNEDTEKLKQELASAKAEIDEMNEHKSEMIWLLKQVIKAEEKQKAQMQGEKKP